VATHTPVMSKEVCQLLAPKPGDVILDCTVGGGGHAAMLGEYLHPGGRYIGMDQDPDARHNVRERCADFPVQLDLIRSNFDKASSVLAGLGVGGVDGVLADLGLSSIQLDDPSRGLSFRHDGPLDMRMDPQRPITAADLLTRLSAVDLADLFFRYGDERYSRKIARLIVEQRAHDPIKTTRQLAALCARAYGSRRGRIDPATRTFQALRIAVNDEMGCLERFLAALPTLLNPGGTAVIISFHSLEDRMVKQVFRDWAKGGTAELLTRKPLQPDEAEVAVNRRSRSAKVRGIRKRSDEERS
jgi:16S rRNA (cytosine1402-N4)-methyltransferase